MHYTFLFDKCKKIVIGCYSEGTLLFEEWMCLAQEPGSK
jgi:hypothetical protein